MIIVCEAILSDCGTWRYTLLRQWDEKLPVLVVIMLNPSTADDKVNDPTILNLIQRAKHNGYGGILVVNLFAYRSSTPDVLTKVPDAVGPDFAYWMQEVLAYAESSSGKVLVAWGNGGALTMPDSHWSEHDLMMDNLGSNYSGIEPVCIGVTKDGYPKHPLARGKHRVPVEAPFVPYEWDAPV